MFGLGVTEIVFILAIALVVVGPKNLPKLARTLGAFFGQVQRMTTDITNTIREETIDLDNEKKKNATVVSATPITPGQSNQDEAPPLSSPEIEPDEKPVEPYQADESAEDPKDQENS